MRVNNEYTNVLITGQNHQGQGVAKINNFTVFVPFAIKGEEVDILITEVFKNYAYGKIIKINKVSSKRQQPICASFGECGGCEIMHFSYDYQLEFKKQMVIDTLERIGGLKDLNISDVVRSDTYYYYRNKVQVPFGVKDGEVVFGFYKKGTHEIVCFDKCYLQTQEATQIAKEVQNILNTYQISPYNEDTHQGVLRHVVIRNNSRGEFMVILITNTKELPFKEQIVKRLVNTFPNIISIIQNVNDRRTNVILGRESKVLYGEDLFIEEILGLEFFVNHKSFLQINYAQTIKMYQEVLRLLNPSKDKVYIDAYCGVGTIGLLLAKHAKFVYGIEIVPEAIYFASKNAEHNNLQNTKFIVGKSEEEISKINLRNVEGIVVDPPRKGCDLSLLEAIIQNKLNKIIYVSCNPATLARDLKILSNDYNIIEVIPFDLFSQTAHVESCVLLERR